MAREFQLPELGENILGADVLRVLVKKGERVAFDQPVLEIETDKATIEVPSSLEGVIKDVFVADGDKVKVGQVVFILEAEGTHTAVPAAQAVPVQAAVPAPETARAPVAAEEPVASSASEMILPELGENIHSADVLKVLVKVGDTINVDDPVLEIETDKATIEVPSTVSGIITSVFIEAGKKAEVGKSVIAVKASSPTPKAVPAAAPVTPAPVTAQSAPQEKQPAQQQLTPPSPRFVPADNQPPILANPAAAAPSVRRLARELGIDINLVPGSGPRGRITLDDVKAFVKSLNLTSREPKATGVPYFEALPDFTKFGEIEKSAMSNIRQKTAEHLSFSWMTVPHVTQFDKADITELESTRKEHAAQIADRGVKWTITSFLIKAISSAMKVYPQFNASVDMQAREIIFKKYFNIGVAVDTERGLMVPVIKNVDRLNINEISLELQRLSEKARARKISPEDLQGGCFTISNLGGIGGTYFTPIVNTPEVAILGVSRGAYEQVYKKGAFEPRLMLPLSLSYDHRLIDGADAIRFLRWVIDALENPVKLLIEG